MGHELHYDSYVCGIHSSEVEREIHENEEYKRKIETEILSLICMDPSKVRNRRRKVKRDEFFGGDDTDYLNNAQYLVRYWEELKEEWENATSKIIRYSDAKNAISDGTKKIYLCPHCLRELKYEELPPDDKHEFSHQELICPECKGVFVEDAADTSGEVPAIATVNTWTEG